MAKSIYIVHDHDGKVISASESKHPARPAHAKDAAGHAYEVPAKFADKKMHEYIRHISVDVASRQLKEKK